MATIGIGMHLGGEYFPKEHVTVYEGKKYWRVQAIRDIAIQKNDIEVLLKWQNYPEIDNSWESLLDIGLNPSGLELLISYKKKIIGDIKIASYRHFGYTKLKRKLKLVKMTIKLFKEKLAGMDQSHATSESARSEFEEGIQTIARSSEVRDLEKVENKGSHIGSRSRSRYTRSRSREGMTSKKKAERSMSSKKSSIISEEQQAIRQKKEVSGSRRDTSGSREPRTKQSQDHEDD